MGEEIFGVGRGGRGLPRQQLEQPSAPIRASQTDTRPWPWWSSPERVAGQEGPLDDTLPQGMSVRPLPGTYLLRDVPLQPGGVWNVGVGVPFTVAVLLITQLKAVDGHDILSKIKRRVGEVREHPTHRVSLNTPDLPKQTRPRSF